MLNGIEDAINAARDPEKVAAQKKQEMEKDAKLKAEIESYIRPAFEMIWRDAALAKEVGIEVAKEDRKAEKAKEGPVRNRDISEFENRPQRSPELESKTQSMLSEGERLVASKDGETFDFGK